MAPDLETIFDVEEAVEAACKTVFESFGVKAFMQRETQDLPKERVDIQLQLGAPTGHRGKMTAGSPGQWVRDAWNGILLVNIITPRMIPDGNGQAVPAPRDSHGKLRARVRIACEHFADRFTAELLPHHCLTKIAQAATDPIINIDDDVDVSALHYDVIVSVRDGAWPAA